MYVFHGEENFKKFGYHPHETYPFVIAAMTPLAVLAIIAGWFKEPFVAMITTVLPELEVHVSDTTLYTLIAVTTAIALSGILFAVFKYKKDGTYFSHALHNRFCYKLLANQYYIPHFLENVINKPYLRMSQFSWKEIDLKVVDVIVDGIAKMVYKTGQESRPLQSGNLSKALTLMVIGLTVLLAVSMFFGLVIRG
jgi:NADH-quinone oxidoreductase subunit L